MVVWHNKKYVFMNPDLCVWYSDRNCITQTSKIALFNLQLAHEGSIDIDTQDSILGQVNLRGLLNKSTFLKLPSSFQFKLMHLLPQVENISDERSKSVK